MNYVDKLKKITLKKYQDTREFKEISNKLNLLDKLQKEETIKPYIQKFKEKYNIDEHDVFVLDYLEKEHSHLWTTISILSTKNELLKTQAIQDKVVDEICDTILTSNYFGSENDFEFNEVLENIKEAIKTHYKVLVWTTQEKGTA